MFIIATRSEKTKQTGMYINTRKTATLPLKGSINQGGSMIFDQDQDVVNVGDLDPKQALKFV
ncbi:unnamed protein product [Clavelina lepadiformis]|uniref:Uncharacterized protein n=1 Tax=Clavelina lepadiformis TaxID=159417 RepID=A0ABP0GIW4_CLALP